MKTVAEQIEVMRAYERGETIEAKLSFSRTYEYVGSTIIFDWARNDYRVAEKPKAKVKMWLWLLRMNPAGVYFPTDEYYTNFTEEANSDYKVIGKIESSMIEVDE